MKKIVATIECRMTSSRLPGKILLPACGRPLLELMIERLKRIPSLDDIVIATTTNTADDILKETARKMDVGFFRGSEDNVMQRVLSAAKQYGADVIVETTSDCPLIDPYESQLVIERFNEGGFDYVSNVLVRSYPRGMETQVFPVSVLEEVAKLTQDPADLENVSLYIYEHPEIFRLGNVLAPNTLHRPEQRLTLDYREDYDLIKNVFESIYPRNRAFLLYDVLEHLDKNPQIAALTSHLQQKPVREEEACL